jgi:hypothetical protein
MKIKNRLILEDEFLKAISDILLLKMPAKQCLEISTCIDALNTQYAIVVRARKAIADKYCQKKEDDTPDSDSKGNLLFSTKEMKRQCFTEIAEILNEEIEINITNKIKINKNEMMTPLRVKLLKDFIDIEE